MRPLRGRDAKGPIYRTGDGHEHERKEANAYFHILPFGFIHAALLHCSPKSRNSKSRRYERSKP